MGLKDNKDTPEYREYSKERLEKLIGQKIRTAFIGAIAEIEENYPDLIDRGQWDRVRADILTKGNNQIRAMHKELEQYDIKWNRYNYQFKIGGNRED